MIAWLRGISSLRFIECEKWRKEFGVDYLVRNFSYDEKPKVFEYYPQYYHKTDKVRYIPEYFSASSLIASIGWTTGIYRTTRQDRSERHVQDHDGRTYVTEPGG